MVGRSWCRCGRSGWSRSWCCLFVRCGARRGFSRGARVGSGSAGSRRWWVLQERVNVVVASMGRGGADRGAAGAVAEVDGVAQFSGREPAHFGDVQEVAVVVGEESVEQGAGLLGEVADDVG